MSHIARQFTEALFGDDDWLTMQLADLSVPTGQLKLMADAVTQFVEES